MRKLPLNIRLVASLCLAWLCTNSSLTAAPVIHAADYTGPIKVACVGDSITFGAGIQDREHHAYPVVLGQMLGDKFQVRNFGVNGATLLKHGDNPYWKTGSFQSANEFEPNVVLIKLGTNDSKPQNWKFKEEFTADLGAMVDHFRALPSHPKVVLCLPVPVYAPHWGINEPVVKDEVIPDIQKVAKEKDIPTVNLHEALANHTEYFPDGVHPNATGAELMAKAIKQALVGE